MSDLPSQYAQEVETFRHILDPPDPRETLPRSSTTVLGLDDEKSQQELRPRGPSAMLSLNPILKDTFEKFEQDFLASNLPVGKYVKPPASTAKYYKLGQPCFEDKLQELSTDFVKICISPKPSGAPMGKVPLLVLKEHEHQARQNLSTINVMEKCQHSIKATFKRVKSQIQKGADPERAARHGYENTCDYFEIMNKRILIQQRALACLSKSVAHILQRLLYTIGNTGLLRHEAEMTLLQPHLEDSSGLQIPSRISPCKTLSREMAQTSGFDPTAQVKFDVANWVACLNGENGHGGTPSHQALLVSPKGALEISSVVGQPPSLDRNHFRTPRVVAESHKHDERCRPSSQRPQYPTVYRRLKQRLGCSLRASLYKGSVVRQGKMATHKCSRRFLLPLKGSRTSVKTKQCWMLRTTQQ